MQPTNGTDKLRINEVFVFVATDEHGDEGIPAFQSSAGMWMPLVAADRARVDSLRPMAKEIAKMTGSSIKLIRMSTREDLEDIS